MALTSGFIPKASGTPSGGVQLCVNAVQPTTTISSPGSDTNVPTEKAAATALADKAALVHQHALTDIGITTATDIGEALADNDTFPVYNTSGTVNRKSAISRLWTYIYGLITSIGIVPRWTTIATSKYTVTPASTSSITMSDTSDMAVGLPVKYTYNSVTYYGIVKSITTNTSISIAGAPLNTGYDLTALYIGAPEMVVPGEAFVSGAFADAAATTLLATDMKSKLIYKGAKGRVVHFAAECASADTGASDPNVNLTVAGNALSTSNSNEGIAVSDTINATEVDINTSNYVINFGDRIEVTTDAAGSSDDAEDLTIHFVIVLE